MNLCQKRQSATKNNYFTVTLKWWPFNMRGLHIVIWLEKIRISISPVSGHYKNVCLWLWFDWSVNTEGITEFSKSCLNVCQVPVLWNAAFQIMDSCKVLGLQIRSWKSAGCKPKETFCPTDVCSYWTILLLSYYSCDGSILLALTFYSYGLNLLFYTAIRSNFFSLLSLYCRC